MADKRQISLPSRSESIHGFFATSEGRSLLRELYPFFRKRSKLGDRKIATIIADIEGVENEKIEVENTRAALIRWKKGQAALWAKDPDKSLRVICRLEQLMMTKEDIKEILDDQAFDVIKQNVGNGFADFFCGAAHDKKNTFKANRIMSKYVGLFQTRVNKNHNERKIFYSFIFRPENKRFLIVHEFSFSSTDKQINISDRSGGYIIPVTETEIYKFTVDY